MLLILLQLDSSYGQSSKVDIDNNSNIKFFEGSKICVDNIIVNNGSSIWAYDYGQVKYGDCTTFLTPTGDGTITLPVEISDTETLPKEFILESAFPNPFNPSITIKYGIPSSSKVKIIIFDIMGQVVLDLFNNDQPAGWYNITWSGYLNNGSLAPASIYLLKIIVDNGINKKDIRTIRISLIK